MTPDSVLDARSAAASELNPSPHARPPRRVKRQPLLTADTVPARIEAGRDHAAAGHPVE